MPDPAIAQQPSAGRNRNRSLLRLVRAIRLRDAPPQAASSRLVETAECSPTETTSPRPSAESRAAGQHTRCQERCASSSRARLTCRHKIVALTTEDQHSLLARNAHGGRLRYGCGDICEHAAGEGVASIARSRRCFSACSSSDGAALHGLLRSTGQLSPLLARPAPL